MGEASWDAVGDTILALVSREPPFVQIFIVLGIAFGVLMILEGLRVSFLPSQKTPSPDAGRDRKSDRALHATAFPEPHSWSVKRNASAQATAGNARPEFRKITTIAKKPGRFPRPRLRRAPLQSFDGSGNPAPVSRDEHPSFHRASD